MMEPFSRLLLVLFSSACQQTCKLMRVSASRRALATLLLSQFFKEQMKLSPTDYNYSTCVPGLDDIHFNSRHFLDVTNADHKFTQHIFTPSLVLLKPHKVRVETNNQLIGCQMHKTQLGL